MFLTAALPWLAVLLGWQISKMPTLEPEARVLGPLPELIQNSRLAGAERLFEGQAVGPESFAEDAQGWIYTGLTDGRIIRFKEDAKSFEVFTRTGPELPSCGSLEMEPVCGRPLALHFDKAGNLIVCDAYKGLLSIDQKGNIQPLAVEAEKQPFMLLNGLAITPDGTIYFTETSRRWTRNQILYESFEARPTGRLMSYNPQTREVKVLARNMFFPNGLALSRDAQKLLIVSTTSAEVLQYDLRSGKLSTLASNLPGIPDNITPHPDKARKTFLVGLGTRRAKPFSLPHFLAPHPWAKVLLGKLVPYSLIVALVPKHSFVLELSEEGEILDTWQDPTGRTPWISEVHFTEKYAYLGSWCNPFVARVPAYVFAFEKAQPASKSA